MSSVRQVEILEAALRAIERREGADLTMAELARAAGLSRQALYLHFADRGALMLELVRYVDQKRGLDAALQRVTSSGSGIEALREFIGLQARMNPQVWAIARAADAVRRADAAVERAWNDRLQNRLRICREIAAKLSQDRVLRPEIGARDAADLIWTATSLRTWEDLVMLRGWSARKYQSHMERLLIRSLTAG